MDVVAADIGGTHARLAIARVESGRVASLGEQRTLNAADYPSLEVAWRAYGGMLGRPLPRTAAIAVASPVGGEVIKLTNSPWIIRPAVIREQLLVDDYVLVNDFGAVGHAVAQAGPDEFAHLCGPDTPLPDHGVVSICGPGTGLGVAQLFRANDGYHVLETEGGHIDFAPHDPIEDALVARLRKLFGRVSAERVCAGPAIVAIYDSLAVIENRSGPELTDRQIWSAALDDGDGLALAAVDRFCLALGSVAGDLALAHGAKAVVIAGGLGFRLKDRLPLSGFAERFAAKGRFRQMMAALPVKLITHPEPGLFGAAAAFAQRYG